jgi:TolB-like protein/Tfp pilus assembly protein PilF
MTDLFAKLRERRLARSGLAYVGVAWVTIQVLDAVADPWGISESTQRAVGVALVFGLLITLVVTWFHGKRGKQATTVAELALVALITFVGGGMVLRVASGPDRATPSEATVEARTVAVMPFLDFSPRGDQQYFADGIAEEIISALTRDGRVRVAARTSSFTLRDQPISVVGSTLGVASVLEGSVRSEGDMVRVTARLVGTDDGFEIWSREFDRPLRNVLEIQRDIAGAVLEQLTGSEAELPDVAEIDPRAYELYLQGRYFWNRRTESDLLRSVDYLEEALEIAPEYARALSGLADAYAVLGFYQALPPEEAFPEALRLADQSLTLDPRLAEALATRAYAKLYYEWDWEGSDAAFRSAIDLNPQYPVAHQWYANALVVQGRSDEAIRELLTAVEIDPLSLVARSALAWAHHYGGEFERATELFAQVLAIDPDYVLAHYFGGWTLGGMGRAEEAVAWFERSVEVSDSSSITLAGLAYAHALAGDGAESDRLLQSLRDPDRTPNPPAYEIGKVYLVRGDLDEAVAWFERAYAGRASQLVFIAVDPDLDGSRSDPRIRDLIQRMGLTAAARGSNGTG